MKKRLIVFSCLWMLGSAVWAQGILFEKGTWEEVLARVKAENKVLFVDVYTSWCGPCKIMAKTIFPQEEVGNYYNQHFINYQLDGEKGEGPAIVEKYKIDGYPTFLYLDGDGEIIYRFSGSRDVKDFLKEAEKVTICARYGGWNKMQAEYASGKGSVDFLKDYYELAGENEKAKALNAYLMALPDEKLCTPEVGKMMEAITQYDYSLLNRMVETRVKMGEQDPDFDFVFTFPLQYKLTGLFQESIQNGDVKLFEELLDLKRKFSVLPGAVDPDIELIRGRGFFFASEEFLNLCYLWQNRSDDERFKTLCVSYIDRLMQENPLDSLAVKRKFLEDEIRQAPETAFFFADNLQEGQQVIAFYLIAWADYYWRMMPSDKPTRERCTAWVNYACRLNPYNAEASLLAANLLIRLKQEKEAIAYLNKAIESQKFLGGADGASLPGFMQNERRLVMKKLNDQLRDIRNKKE